MSCSPISIIAWCRCACGLLRAEIWSLGTQAKHLSRVSACVVDDSALTHPVVIAHGRIVVLGGDNHRLHEEIITAGGALIEGRFSRLNVGETKAALPAATDTPAPAAIEARFQACGASIVMPCWRRSKHAASNAPRIWKRTSKSWRRKK